MKSGEDVYVTSYRGLTANSNATSSALEDRIQKELSSTLVSAMGARAEYSARHATPLHGVLAGLLLALGALVGSVGCASIGPPEAPALELPKPPTDLKATRKGDKITLTWAIPARTTERQSVRYLGKTAVCRGSDPVLVRCGVPVGEVAPPADFASKKDSAGKKLTDSYTGSISAERTDQEKQNPFATVTYAIEVRNEDGRSAGLSNQVHVPLAETLAAPKDFAAKPTAQGIVLSWTGARSPTPSPLVRYGYRVLRRQDGNKQESVVGEVAEGDASILSLTDQSFEWEKTYYYRAESFTVLAQPGKPEIRIEGEDTPEVEVFAHDVFPPAVPSGLQAVFSGPGQQPFIDLIWAPVGDTDLAGYDVYRREEGTAPVKLNAEAVKTPVYRDAQVVSGKAYFYSVSAVDEQGNESGRSVEASERVP